MRAEAEKILAELVAMPTVTDDIETNNRALDYVEKYLAERGMFTRRFVLDGGHGALMASTRAGNAKRPAVLLAAHIDVVPAGKELFALRREDNKLTGRGVFDMKFAIAGYMALVDELKDTLDDYDFAIMLTTDEEPSPKQGMDKGTQQLVAKGYTPGICILPDSAAPGWNIEESAKTAWRFKLKAKGQTAHGSRPWEGDSASLKLISALHEIKQIFKDHGPKTDTLNIGVINGGETFNQIPDYMEAALEVRIVDHGTKPQLMTKILDICGRHDITYQEAMLSKKMKTDLSHPLVKSYMESVEAVTGHRPKPVLSFGSSDGPYFVEAGVQCVISCPDGGGHHSEEEWIDRKQFLQFVPVVRHFLNKHARNAATSVDNEAANLYNRQRTLPKTAASGLSAKSQIKNAAEAMNN